MKYILSIIFLCTLTNAFYAAGTNKNNYEAITTETSEYVCQNCLHQILKGACSEIEDVAIIESILSKIENINAETQDITALHIAAANNSLEVVKCLVEKGANVNAKTVLSATPAHMAARHDKLSTVLFLKKHGANTSIEDITKFKVDTYLTNTNK